MHVMGRAAEAPRRGCLGSNNAGEKALHTEEGA